MTSKHIIHSIVAVVNKVAAQVILYVSFWYDILPVERVCLPVSVAVVAMKFICSK